MLQKKKNEGVKKVAVCMVRGTGEGKCECPAAVASYN